MLSAGHCAAGGVTVNQGYIDRYGVHINGAMGNVTHVSYCDWCLDGEFLDAAAVGKTVQREVYTTGGQTGNNYAILNSWGQSSVGMQVCTDGSFTTENCSGTVLNTELCVQVYDDVTGTYKTICNLTEVGFSVHYPGCQGGDSGGPAYRYLGASYITAYGLNESGNTYGDDCFYTEIRDAMNVLGVTLITSG